MNRTWIGWRLKSAQASHEVPDPPPNPDPACIAFTLLPRPIQTDRRPQRRYGRPTPVRFGRGRAVQLLPLGVDWNCLKKCGRTRK
jgi:hypothetical protein